MWILRSLYMYSLELCGNYHVFVLIIKKFSINRFVNCKIQKHSKFFDNSICLIFMRYIVSIFMYKLKRRHLAFLQKKEECCLRWGKLFFLSSAKNMEIALPLFWMRRTLAPFLRTGISVGQIQPTWKIWSITLISLSCHWFEIFRYLRIIIDSSNTSA